MINVSNYILYYFNLAYFLVLECTQLEDPRLEWRAIQEAMLRDYLHTAQDVLEVSTILFTSYVVGYFV